MNLAGTIYGTVIVTALVTGLNEHDDYSPGEIAVSVTVTMLAFWIAHAYATLLAGDATGGRLPRWGDVRRALRHEFPIVQPVAGPLVFLTLGETGILSETLSEDLAIAAGLAILALAGWVLARRDRARVGAAILVAVGSAALGVVVIGVKLAVE